MMERAGSERRASAVDRLDAFPTMTRDLGSRSAELDWPPGFDPEQADWFSHNEALIDAPVSRVCDELTAAPNWPRCRPVRTDEARQLERLRRED